MQQLKPDLRMLLLVRGSLLENLGNLHVTVLSRLGSVEGVLIARLGFPGERRHQIGFCLGTF